MTIATPDFFLELHFLLNILDEVRDKAGRGSDRVCRTIAATDLRLVAPFVS